MKVFDTSLINSQATGDYILLANAIVTYQKECKNHHNQWQTLDIQFEEKYRCKILYGRTEGYISHILFEDEDWFWFKSIWL